VTSGYFRTLRINPQRGRAFESADETGPHYVILSDGLWRTRFGSTPSAIGATVQLSAEPYVVVGIAPPGFQDPIVGDVDAWVPYDLARNSNEENYTLTAFGRLRTGVHLEQAQGEIAALTRGLAAQWPGVRASTLVVHRLKDDLVAPSRRTLQGDTTVHAETAEFAEPTFPALRDLSELCVNRCRSFCNVLLA